MRAQPNRNYTSNDDVQTPAELARQIVAYFCPTGRVLEPCKGDGNFLAALPTGTSWCEVKDGRDFFAWKDRVEWVITNPPWSQLRQFLEHAMSLAEEVVFLVTVNHLWTKARVRGVREAGFGLREIVLVDTPATWPSSGFQLGVIWFSRRWQGPTAITDWTTAAKVTTRASSPPSAG